MYGFVNTGLRELMALQKGQRRTKRVRLSRRFRQRIYWRDGGCCVYCEKPIAFKDATMDHVQPLTQRGKNRSKENIVTACHRCNDLKGPLVMDKLDDLSPEALWVKFHRMVELTEKRKGSFTESMW